MRIGRLVLVVATLVAILVFPLVARDALQALRMPSAYAAPDTTDAAGRVYQNGNNNGNNNDNDDGNNGDDDDNDNNNDGSGDGDDNESSDNEGEDNDNVECYLSLNDNDPVPCDFDDNANANANDNFYSDPGAPAAPAPAQAYTPPSRRCFDAQEVGDVRLILGGGSVVIRVVPPAGLPQVAWVELDDIEDMSGIPAPPGGATLLDTMIWRMDAGSPCDGGPAGMLPGAVNLGIPYHVSADKSKLQIVRLVGGQWVEVLTVPDPDPNNPYISSTVQETGIYAVIQKP